MFDSTNIDHIQYLKKDEMERYIEEKEHISNKEKKLLASNYHMYSDINMILKYHNKIDLETVLNRVKLPFRHVARILDIPNINKTLIYKTQSLKDSYVNATYFSDSDMKYVLKNTKLSEDTLKSKMHQIYSFKNTYMYQNIPHMITFYNNITYTSSLINWSYMSAYQNIDTKFSAHREFIDWKALSKNKNVSYNFAFKYMYFIKWKYFDANHFTDSQLLTLINYVNWDLIDLNDRSVDLIAKVIKYNKIKENQIAKIKNDSIVLTFLSINDIKKNLNDVLSVQRSEYFIRTICHLFENRFFNNHWKLISDFDLSEQFVVEYENFLNLKYLRRVYEFSDEFLTRNSLKIDWTYICSNKKLFSENFCDIFDRFIDWKTLFNNTLFPDSLRLKYRHKTECEYLKTHDNPWFNRFLEDRLSDLSKIYNISDNKIFLTCYTDEQEALDKNYPVTCGNISYSKNRTDCKKIRAETDSVYMFSDGTIRVTNYKVLFN